MVAERACVWIGGVYWPNFGLTIGRLRAGVLIEIDDELGEEALRDDVWPWEQLAMALTRRVYVRKKYLSRWTWRAAHELGTLCLLPRHWSDGCNNEVKKMRRWIELSALLPTRALASDTRQLRP
jgi:hypothetical protein